MRPNLTISEEIIRPVALFDYRTWWESAILVKWDDNCYGLPWREMYTFESVYWAVEQSTQEIYWYHQNLIKKYDLLNYRINQALHHVFLIELKGTLDIKDQCTLWFYPLRPKCESERNKFAIYQWEKWDQQSHRLWIDEQSKKILDEIRKKNMWVQGQPSNVTIARHHFDTFRQELASTLNKPWL